MNRHFLFEDCESEEYFLVCASMVKKAKEIAYDNFGEDAQLICEFTEFEAENSGLDEY